MPSSYLSPGVFVEEIKMGRSPIAAGSTSTAAFLGVAPLKRAHLNEPLAVNNWSQFLREFVADDSPSTDLGRAAYGFFDNGGGRCYICNVGEGNPLAGDARISTGLQCLERIDEIAIVAAPGFCDLASHEALISHCEKMGDRFAILDSPEEVANIDRLKEVATVEAAAPVPAASSTGEEEGQGATKRKSRPSNSPKSGLRPRVSDSGCAAFYFPWLIAPDPLASGKMTNTPPSGHLAGIYARTDSTRGVHKAPANESIRNALGLTYRVTREEQGELNRSGVNCIRFFPSSGIRVWGARTIAEEASEWRYINVRRLFNMIEEAIADGTRWVVFEPNDEGTWKAVERDIRAFLTLIWRDGALMGRTPEEAFFVKCDAETNPTEVIDAGRLVVEIGIAPVKPAEFIIFRIGQCPGEVDIETAS
jgi:Bacteriophage tail sheath protein